MKKEEVEAIFDEVWDCLEFHFQNADDKEDLIERINKDLRIIEEKFTEE